MSDRPPVSQGADALTDMFPEPINSATDAELVSLFSLDSVEELISIAAGKGGKLFIDTCTGQWVKYETSERWTFNPEEDE